jgi:hypothetical protein
VGVFPRQTVLMSESNVKSADVICYDCGTHLTISAIEGWVTEETVNEWLLDTMAEEGWTENDDRPCCGECS